MHASKSEHQVCEDPGTIPGEGIKHDDLIIINGGSFGKRIQNILLTHSINVRLITTSNYTSTINRLYLLHVYGVSTAIQRKQYYSDYSISTTGSTTVNWGNIKDIIKKRVDEVRRSINHTENTYSVKEVNEHVYINNIKSRARNIVLVDYTTATDTVTLDNIWVKLVNDMASIPKSVFISGGNKKSVETASILSDLGCKVYVSTGDDVFLSLYEKNIQESVKNLLLEKGVTVFFNSQVISVNKTTFTTVTVSDGSITQTLTNLEYFLSESEYSITQDTPSTPGNSRITRITAPYAYLKHAEIDLLTRIYPGIFTVHDIPVLQDMFRLTPSFIYTNPPAASVGCTEIEANKSQARVRVINPKFRGLFYSVCQNKSITDYKLIFTSDNKEVLSGLHLFGPSSIDIIKGFSIGMYCKLSPEDILSTIPIHPTSSEEVITG
ncbi:glutathione reductase (NADPH) [Nematocida parisii]|nr:glutathione reductase (NADPH) [Nematocida parisii]KAI5128378.1 glutathione reductase (NADPH) [Nematocida parisii]KAI5141694.1 glutathione reductase (NADPH) [Nematocida parisii]